MKITIIRLRPIGKNESWGSIEIEVQRETDEYWFGPIIKNLWVLRQSMVRSPLGLSMTWNKSQWMKV